TIRRSAAGREAAAGRAAPQWWQNRAPGTATVPHTEQVTASPTPPRVGVIPVADTPVARGPRIGPPARGFCPHPRRPAPPPLRPTCPLPSAPPAPGQGGPAGASDRRW